MKFKNIATKKGNIEYVPGDVLVVCNEYEEEAYMVFKKDGMYNLIDLNRGKAYLLDNQNYEDFAENMGRLLYSAEVIKNDKLELVRVED